MSSHVAFDFAVAVATTGIVVGDGLSADPSGNDDSVDGATGVAERPEPFTAVVLPDSREYSESYPEILEEQTEWIVENRDARNSPCVNFAGSSVAPARPDRSCFCNEREARTTFSSWSRSWSPGPGEPDAAVPMPRGLF